MPFEFRARGASCRAAARTQPPVRARSSSSRLLAPLAAALLLSSVLAGCASRLDVPAPAAYAPSSQLTSRAAHHWDVMAADIAAHLAERLRDWPPGEHPIYIVPSPDPSGFGRGLRQLLATHLVERGLAVSTDPTPLELRVITQLVQHHAGAPLTSRGAWLADGIQVERGSSGYGPIAHAPAAPAGPLRTEILVTTSLEREQRLLVRTSDVYSIAQDDLQLYQTPLPEPAAAAPAATLRSWKVVP
ncbi:hypothetical protein [Paracidovorax wautersii]|uniref:Uncharacterized protein n=1 Tax=Paracidovorax wautersii TaxID=1177982 RepID=A0A1I2EI74_9BURK|nr:hypothetical protein [Paracidovorax wautersii]SFE92449.1 hypothetical protein SAMN04489711_107138 [Paracidovorax wautersii]